MPSFNAAIVGSNGGIGRALFAELEQSDQVSKVFAFSRDTLDIESEASIEAAAKDLKDQGVKLDLVIVATGLLHANGLAPEKSIRDLSAEKFERLFAVNTIGPMLVAKHFLPLMPRNQRTVFAALSARVGSISDNRMGGWYAYRAAKAALNMGIKNLAIETARRNPEAIIVGLHPGTTDTGLSKPFQANVEENKLFSTQFVATSLLSVLDSLSADNSGDCFDWAGNKIEA